MIIIKQRSRSARVYYNENTPRPPHFAVTLKWIHLLSSSRNYFCAWVKLLKREKKQNGKWVSTESFNFHESVESSHVNTAKERVGGGGSLPKMDTTTQSIWLVEYDRPWMIRMIKWIDLNGKLAQERAKQFYSKHCWFSTGRGGAKTK